MAGTLFIVATPIGNLEDLSFRALRTLREVDLIVAEDTRRTAKLLAHYEIHRPMVSLHAHNEHREAPRIVQRLESGVSVALVSDAGTPGIADPGELLVRLARELGIRVIPIPGASAIMAALSISGLPASEFVFMGFAPRSGAERTRWMERLASERRTVVFFEVPHRVDRTISNLANLLVNRQIQVNRELTKINEELIVCTNQLTGSQVRPQGEFVVVVGPMHLDTIVYDSSDATVDLAANIIGCMTENGAISEAKAEDLISRALSIDPVRIHSLIKKHRIAIRRKAQADS